MRRRPVVWNALGIIIWLALPRAAEAQVINTAAGGGPENAHALAANLSSPWSVAVDSDGLLFIAAKGQHRIFKVDPSGQLQVAAGNGIQGFSGDGGSAKDATMALPQGIALDPNNNLFIADYWNHRIRRVDAVTGIITTYAGSGLGGFEGDGGLATNARITSPGGLAVDALGNLLIADSGNSRIRRVDATTGIITTIAGTGSRIYAGDGGPATSASLADPTGVDVDGDGNVFIADRLNARIRRISAATGIITTIAGSGTFGFSGDGGPATSAHLANANDVALDSMGNVFITDSTNHRVRRVDASTGIITTVAGSSIWGSSGDGGPAIEATLNTLRAIAFDGENNYFLADESSRRIRRVDGVTGIITTVAGNGSERFGGEGAAATAASLFNPAGVAIDPSGNFYISDSANERIRRVDATSGLIVTVAGSGMRDFGGDGGPANEAKFRDPLGIALDADGNLFIADDHNARVRRVDVATGIITTVAGNGMRGFSGDGGLATAARLDRPSDVALDAGGNLFIADLWNQRIRRVDAVSGIITTFAGVEPGGYGGDGGPATSARFRYPIAVAVDGNSNLFIADQQNYRIRRVDTETGIITTVAGSGGGGFRGDGGPAILARINRPGGIDVDENGNLFIADTENQRVRRVDAVTRVITTFAGNGCTRVIDVFPVGCFGGDGGQATSASLDRPSGVALDPAGNLLVVDAGNQRIRQIGDAVLTLEVDLDIQPDGSPNSINPTNEGVVPVAILGSDVFDVIRVDGLTLRFAKNEAAPIHDLDDSVIFANHLRDVNGDGIVDLVSHYRTAESGIAFGDMSACLSGLTLDGVHFRSCDAVRTVPDMDGDGLLDPEEDNIGSNPFFRDSDGDGYADGIEVLTLGTDPLDALDPAPTPDPVTPRRRPHRDRR